MASANHSAGSYSPTPQGPLQQPGQGNALTDDPVAVFRSAADQYHRSLTAIEKMAGHRETGGDISEVAAREAIAQLPLCVAAMDDAALFLGPEVKSLRPELEWVKELTRGIFAAITSKSDWAPPSDLAKPVVTIDSDGNEVKIRDPRETPPDWRKLWSLDALGEIGELLREPSNRKRLAAWRAVLKDWEAQQAKSNRQPTAKKPKRSTEKGEARTKLTAALTKHHQYADGGCLNLEPIGNNQLAQEAGGLPRSTASAFFKREFDGYAKYRVICRDSGRLADSLKVLNDEFCPHDLYGRQPARERHRGDEADE